MMLCIIITYTEPGEVWTFLNSYSIVSLLLQDTVPLLAQVAVTYFFVLLF